MGVVPLRIRNNVYEQLSSLISLFARLPTSQVDGSPDIVSVALSRVAEHRPLQQSQFSASLPSLTINEPFFVPMLVMCRPS
jgi:hypothetical protein